ncbi:partial peptidoglycan DL-endopeptidase CwlO, partial [Methylacidimicrobium cyclopophantes]
MNWEQVGALIGAVVAVVFLGFTLLAMRLKRLMTRLEEVSHDVSEARADIRAWEKELRTVRAEAQNTRGEVQSTRGELQSLRTEMHDHWATMGSVKQALHRVLLDQASAGSALPASTSANLPSEPAGMPS